MQQLNGKCQINTHIQYESYKMTLIKKKSYKSDYNC